MLKLTTWSITPTQHRGKMMRSQTIQPVAHMGKIGNRRMRSESALDVVASASDINKNKDGLGGFVTQFCK